MSAEPLPDQTALHGLDEGIALALRAQDSGDWKPVVDWLARHPEYAQAIDEFLHCAGQIPPMLAPARTTGRAGASIGHFELIELLGSGAMGDVYRARDRRIDREVAVKVVRIAGLSAAELVRARFEAQAMAELHHPNVVPLLDFDETDAEMYFAMPLVSGGTLAQRIKDRGEQRHGAEESARLVRDVALGVHHAHQRGLIHRDLKPANILLDKQDQKVVPRIADFGLARRVDATMTLGIAGTLAYMAPEQAQGGALTTAVDVRALGAILFELLTGRVPYTGDAVCILKKLTDSSESAPTVRSQRPDVHADLDAICRKCLERNPNDRYPTAQELADDLDRFLRREPVKARPPGLWGSVVREVLRTQFENPTAWGWLTLLLGLLAAVFHLFNGWAISNDLSQKSFATVSAVYLLAIAVLFWAFLRNTQFRFADRHSLSLWIGGVLATILLSIVYRPPEGGDLAAYRLSFYPFMAIIAGLWYFAAAAPFWSGFYLIGLGHFALALVMKAFPEAAPVTYSASCAVTVLLGVFLIRLGNVRDAIS